MQVKTPDNAGPRARTSDLIVEELGEETLVYDLRRDRVHCLNPAATAVWRRCDGRNTPDQIGLSVSQDLGRPADASFVQLALQQLARARLLEPVPEAAGPRLTRRSLGARLGKSLAVALPAVLSITAPNVASAASIGPCTFSNADCVAGQECWRCGTSCNRTCHPITKQCVGATPPACDRFAPMRARSQRRGGSRFRTPRDR